MAKAPVLRRLPAMGRRTIFAGRSRCAYCGHAGWPSFADVAAGKCVFPTYTDFCICSRLNVQPSTPAHDGDVLPAWFDSDGFEHDGPLGNTCRDNCSDTHLQWASTDTGGEILHRRKDLGFGEVAVAGGSFEDEGSCCGSFGHVFGGLCQHSAAERPASSASMGRGRLLFHKLTDMDEEALCKSLPSQSSLGLVGTWEPIPRDCLGTSMTWEENVLPDHMHMPMMEFVVQEFANARVPGSLANPVEVRDHCEGNHLAVRGFLAGVWSLPGWLRHRQQVMGRFPR